MLHPFERYYSAPRTGYSKPHCFLLGGRWHKVDVPTDGHVFARHAATGAWLREKNNGPCRASPALLHSAVARRAVRHFPRY